MLSNKSIIDYDFMLNHSENGIIPPYFMATKLTLNFIPKIWFKIILSSFDKLIQVSLRLMNNLNFECASSLGFHFE